MIPISAMTSAYRDRATGLIDQPEAIRKCKAAGFDVLDLTLHPMKKPADHTLAGDDWEYKLEEVLRAKDETGVTFYQTHPDFRPGHIRSYPDSSVEEFFWKMVYRGLDITARIGAKWAVIHPVNDPSTLDVDTQLKLNHRVYDDLVDYAAKLGIGIAFDNMVESPKGGPKPHRFVSMPEELIAVHDSFNCDHVKLCWDFGHANTAVPERHPEALRMLGSRLVCTHVDDNNGKKDDHFLPFRGTVCWEEVMPVLKEIHYPGTLNLEVPFSTYMPGELRDDAVRLQASIARKLSHMAEGL